ncbi:MAG: aldo/keto reductase [Gammaproteobacteria bacterium]|nr:aldo/keto reductase [Gammaproteobacteria bacterium]MDH5652073.1 aldo/keto reductase [Gammaproteobacteria bacterium]
MKLALGTVQFGLDYGIANQTGMVSIDEAGRILLAASNHNIDTLDTAIAYGESETRLGEIGVNEFKVISKLPSVPDDCKDISDWVRTSVAASLSRLKLNKLYGLLLHRPAQLLQSYGDEYYAALLKLQDDGLVQNLGLSIYEPAELDMIPDKYSYQIVQGPFNILDERMIKSGWLNKLADSGVEFHARSIFLQGLLLMSKDKRPAKFDRWNKLWALWDNWLLDMDTDPVAACVSYAVSHTEVTKVVVGVNTALQLEEIITAADTDVAGLPINMTTNDIDLINPARWSAL